MSPEGEQIYRSWVEVDLDHFRRNVAEVRRLVGPRVRILQVVKADAYGHGAIEIARAAVAEGASHLGVANADEGVQLRVAGIEAPILILSPSLVSEIPEIIKYDLTPSVSDLPFAETFHGQLQRAGRTGTVHIEVDTGMGRGGTMHGEALEMVRRIASLPALRIEGVFTHLASSEIPSEFNREQHRLFQELLSALTTEGIRIPLRHMANSGAVMNYPEFHLDMVRPGIMTYGIHPSMETRSKAALWPVMTFKSRIALLKEFPAGQSIGYNRTFVTDRPTLIATIPVGYGDGYGLLLSNQGEALVRGRRVPVVGRISMDMCTLDVTGVPDCRMGDEVVFLGRQGGEYISATRIGERLHTTGYEVLCALGKRAPRVFIDKGRADAVAPRLRRVFLPEEEKSLARINQMMRYCLQARAQDAALGDAIYHEMLETLFGKEHRRLELRTGFRYQVTVSDVPAEEQKAKGEQAETFFRVATHVSYTKTFTHPVFLIGCALNNEQLAAFFEDERCEYRWLLNRGEDPVTEQDFRVQRVCIDKEAVPILRTENTARGYEIWCGSEALEAKRNRPVRVEISVATKKSKNTKIFSVYLVYPTRGLEIVFDYSGTTFRNVKEVSFLAGRNPYPEILREKGRSVRIRTGENDWIFPVSGVAFAWD